MTQLTDILKLSVPERILMVEAIWDSIASEKGESSYELDDETKNMLDERIANHEANPSSGSSWDEVKARIASKL